MEAVRPEAEVAPVGALGPAMTAALHAPAASSAPVTLPTAVAYPVPQPLLFGLPPPPNYMGGGWLLPGWHPYGGSIPPMWPSSVVPLWPPAMLPHDSFLQHGLSPEEAEEQRVKRARRLQTQRNCMRALREKKALARTIPAAPEPVPLPAVDAAPPEDLTVPQKPPPGHVWCGRPELALRMLKSEQFEQTHPVRSVIADLCDISQISSRTGTPEPPWQVVVGHPPIEAEQYVQYDDLVQMGPRTYAFSLRELVRHGPVGVKATMDVVLTHVDSGFVLPVGLEPRLQEGVRFLAQHYKDPGRGDEHAPWAEGDHRMCGLRANPRDGGVNQYSPAEGARRLADPDFLEREAEMLAAFGEFLRVMNQELERIMPVHAAKSNAARFHTHNYNTDSRHPAFDAPQTTAGCAINFPAFGAHTDRNVGLLSPFVCIWPERLKQQQQCQPAAMQYTNTLAYKQFAPWDPALGGVSTHWFNSDGLHAFRPDVNLRTERYIDYALPVGGGTKTKIREKPQNDRWQVAKKAARQAAFEALHGTEMEEAALELEVKLTCGPLPIAGLLQERCLSHMTSQQGDTRHVELAARAKPLAKPKPKPAAPQKQSSRLKGLPAEVPRLRPGVRAPDKSG